MASITLFSLALVFAVTFASPLQMRAVSNGGVGFSAHRLHDENVGSGQVLVFDQVTTNEGNGYNPSTGVFTCPMNGLYFFSVNILSHIHHPFTGKIVLDGTALAGVYSVGASSSVCDQSTGSAVSRCMVGQGVSLISAYNALVNGEVVPFTSFNGFLIAADEDMGVIG